MTETNPPDYLGVDWAAGYWVVVGYSTDEPVVRLEPSIFNVWESFGKNAEAILIDIPIGLPVDEPRECDTAASNSLDIRSSSVFSVPCRDAIEARSYDDAVDANEKAGFGGISSQSWGIVPRIREMDAFLEKHKNADEKIFESHPEVCYSTLSSEQTSSKATPDGIQERLDVLENEDPEFGSEIRSFVDSRNHGNAEWHHRIQSGRVDDVLDAAVLALTAKTSHPTYRVLPEGSDPDDPPVIVYPN